jgi:hypothetical protein
MSQRSGKEVRGYRIGRLGISVVKESEKRDVSYSEQPRAASAAPDE